MFKALQCYVKMLQHFCPSSSLGSIHLWHIIVEVMQVIKMKKDKQLQIFKGITKNIFILGLVSLFTDLSSQMVFPLIPLFLTTVLGAGAYVVGIVEGAAETTASLLKVVSGYWSDKIKKGSVLSCLVILCHP